MNYAPMRGEYKEVICFKNISIIHIDWGNIEVFEGESYRECLSGFGHLRENICKDDCVLRLMDICGRLIKNILEHLENGEKRS